MKDLMRTVEDNLAHVRDEIGKACLRSGRRVEEVEIMGVTKTHPPEYVEAAIRCGIRHIGENRVSEGGRKVNAVGREMAVFHLIGVIHRSEVRQAVRDFHCIDAVDRVRILEEIVRREASPRILLEVNTSGEEAKKGFPPDGTLLETALGFALENGLQVDGLLTVGPLGAGEIGMREAFSSLRELRDRLSASLGVPLPALSMGMSDDFSIAVEEGSTIVRLGRILFGPRG